MAFFRQLRLLLWKNGLGVLRHPLWSLTLIVWPLIIFIIVAVTREQFPPVVKETCYVAPRNLPSTGLFPFLQTLMCSTDSSCHNKSRLTTEAGSRTHQRSPRVARSVRPLESPLANLFEGRELLNFSQDARKDAAALIQVLNNFLGPGRQRDMHEALSMIHSMNSTLLGDPASWEEAMQSDDVLKRAICRLALPMLNTTSPAPLAHALVTFCTSNDTLFEVSLMTIYQMLMDQVVTQPEEMGTMAGMVVLLFEQLQDHDSLWEGLLAIPHLLSSGSVDEGMDTLKTLLTNLQRVLSDISGDFPESNATVSALHPGLAGAINLIHYVQNWPGRDVSVSLADVVTLHNDSLSEMMKQVLQLVEIPLDQAAVLSWDKDLVLSHLCDNSSRPLAMALPCITGTVHMLLSWISPDKLAKQCVLQWSKHVAQHDVAFATGLLHGLMGGPNPGGHGGANMMRSRRSLQTQPQNDDEDLFLSVGNVVLGILGNFPEVDQLLQSMLTFAYQSMQMAAFGIDSAAETIENACQDASRVEMMLQSLLTNQSESSTLLGRILDSAMEVITKSLTDPEHQNGSCVEALAPFEWLLPNNSFSTEEWRSMMCGNGSLVQHALQMDWMAAIEKGFQIADAINPRNMDNSSVTLPMILSAWRQLLNSSMTFGALIETMASGLGEAYWTNWMPDNSTQSMAETLQQSVFWSLVSHGQRLEQSEDWPPMEPYFHMAYWVLSYTPNITAPPNCSLSSNLFAHCNTGLDWTQFVHLLSKALMSPRLDTLVNCLKGTVTLLHSVYGDVAKFFGEAYLKEELQGADALSTYLTQLLHNLDGFAQNVSALPDGDMQEYQALMQLLQSSGLAPLLPLFTSSGPLNVSAILDAASKWGRLNQHIFTFNETDPTLPKLEQLLRHFLSFEGNLTVSLSQAMGNSLVTYSDYFHPDDAARFLEAIRPLTNQTSAGSVEAILRSIELLKTVMDAPEGDPTPVILGYLRQFQQFIASLYRLRKVENIWLPDGTPSAVTITDLSPLSTDFLNLLTPESLGSLAQAGADTAQEIVAQKFIAFLPPSIQQEAALFLKDFKDLQGQVATCESGQNCLGVVSEISMFLNQIVDMMQTTDGNVSITLEAPSPYLEGAKELIASTAFRLLLPPAAATGVETFQQVLDFVKMLTAGPEVTVSSIREALSQSDLTLEDLQAVAAQTGAADTKELALSVMDVMGVSACFQEQAEPQVTAQCVSELVHGIGGFLARVPALRNATALLELLPAVFNQTASDLARLNFSAGADGAVLHALSKTLDAIKTNLQMNGMATPEILDEITALEGLLKIAANPPPLSHLSNASADPLHFEKGLYEVMQWYLERLENVTQSSAISDLLYPFFRITQVEVALQLAHTEFGLFLSRRIEELMSNLQLPIDHEGLMMIGQTVVNSLRRLLDNVMQSFQTQNTYAEVFDQEPPFNATMLDATKHQIQMYLNRIEEWTQQPNVSLALAGVLNWRNFNLSAGADGAMLHALSQALDAVKTNLQMTGMATPEIMDEITALEGLLKVAANPAPLNHLFNVSAEPFHFNKALYEVMQWYLERLENVTQSSAVSELLYPFFRVTQVEVALQLGFTKFGSFLTRQIDDLMSNLRLPIDREGVMMVGQTVITSLRRLLDTVKLVLQSQNTFHEVFDQEPAFNATMLDATEHQIHMYLNGIEEWMQQSNVSMALTSMLHWGNFNISASRPLADVHLLLQNVAPFLSPDQKAFLSLIGNITRSLNAAIAAAEQPGGLNSADFSAAVLEVYQTVAPLLPMEPLPLPVLEEVQGIVQDSVELLLGQNMSFPASVNMSLHVLWRAEAVVHQALPEGVAAYLLPPIKVATTYFETIATYSGPDNWNQMILNQMETVQSLLPPNSTAQAYVSALIDITHSILDSGQGNMSLWESFENGTTDSFPMMLGLAERLLSAVWPLLSPALGPHMPPPPLGSFAHLPWVLEQLMSGQAQPHTWHRLEHMLTALLSTMVGTEHWDQFTSVVPLFEKLVADAVNSIHAQNALMESLQTPVTMLLSQISQSINSSRFNVSELWEGAQRAVEGTLQAAQQANGTLECSAVLEAWEPLREAAGLSPSALASWCDVSLQPVLEAYAASQHLYDNLSMNHTGTEPETAKEAAARMVAAMQWLYHANANNTALSQQLLSALTGQLGAPQPLSHLSQQLQHMHMANSIWSLGALSDELLSVAPQLRPYVEALESSLNHVLANSNLSADALTSEQVFAEAAMLFLSHANITKDGAFPTSWGDLPHLMTSVGNLPMLHQAMEQLLGSEQAGHLIQTMEQTLMWLASSEASGLELLGQALPRVYEVLRTLLSALPSMEMPAQLGPLQDLLGNILATERETFPQTPPRRRRREAPPMPPREPMDDFLDLLNIDYPSMFRALAVPPTPEEVMETAHVLFSNPDLGVVMTGASAGLPWAGMNVSQEHAIHAALGFFSFLTLPGAAANMSMGHLPDMLDMLPDRFPFSLIKNLTRVMANESHENMLLLQQSAQTASELLYMDPTNPLFMDRFQELKSQVCMLEQCESARLLMQAVSMETGQLCHTYLPDLEKLLESLQMNGSQLSDAVFQTIVGDPKTFDMQMDWTSVLNEVFDFNISSLSSLKLNLTSPVDVTFGELLRNESAFAWDVHHHMDFDPQTLQLLLATELPKSNMEILSWLMDLRHCSTGPPEGATREQAHLFATFCSMSAGQWYSFILLTARHLDTDKLIYSLVLSEEMQGLVGAMLQVTDVLVKMMNKMLPAIGQLETFMLSVQDLNLVSNAEFSQMARGQRSSISSRATFVTLSRALCSKGIMALFGISKLPQSQESDPSFGDQSRREEMIDRFKIPRTATPFCMNMYLDMVNTTGGAIAWAFLKPMLMGDILFAPDTPLTRDIMNKANATLHEFANLRNYSMEWVESSGYIVQSAQLLSHTLPMLQNSLGNAFVKNFIEMQTDINVDSMKETLSSFSNMTLMLQKNRHVLDQLTTLSTLMLNISSCIKFDRYRGFDTPEEMDQVAQDLAKNRDLYGSVIFKLPKDERSSSSSLPAKVRYTIRMHMDNVMRTDRARLPYYVNDPHISARETMRYNRGFVYLQENIERAIIQAQTGATITQTAVQLQAFPYPCHQRDEYLEAVSFVFPLMLMIAWILFVAEFVKKLVHERELRLHEYMKMMGVSPLSHFFAWFVECASYLGVTIFILTLLLKYGGVLPNSDGFLIFLYLCDYGLSVLALSYLISSFFDKTYIAGLSGSLLYILAFFPYIVVMAVETSLTFSQKSLLSLFSPTCFSYASQYITRYESQGEGIQWSNSYHSPIAEDTASFGWLCWLMLIDSVLYFIIGAYIRMVFPGAYGLPAPWYFPFTASFWSELCCCGKSRKAPKGLFITNIMQDNQQAFPDDKAKGGGDFSSQTGGDFSHLPVGVNLLGLTKTYGERTAIHNLNVAFYEGHVTALLGHNGAGKTTTMSLLTGLFAPSSGSIEVYGRDMQSNLDEVRRELGVCMQYDVLFDHMTAEEHLLLYGQIKAPHWSKRELKEQVRTTLVETGMLAHRGKRVGTLSGGMRRKLSISIAFIGGSRLVVLDEPTTGVDPCSRRSIWDIVIQHKKQRTIIMSTHHLDEAEVLSDRIAFLERGGLKCCGSPFYLKDKLGQGYKLTLTKKMGSEENFDAVEMKSFIQAHVPEARLKEAQGGDLVYSLPPFTSANASAYRSLLTALDANLHALQLSGYGVSDTTLEEVFLQLTQGSTDDADAASKDAAPSVSHTISQSDSMESLPNEPTFSDTKRLTSSVWVRGVALAWQQMLAIIVKRFHHSRRDYKGLLSQLLLPVLFVIFAMALGSIKSDLRHYPELELSPALYKVGPSFSFFSNQNPSSKNLADTMMSFPGIDNSCLDGSGVRVCTKRSRVGGKWESSGNSSKAFNLCKCTQQTQVCDGDQFQPPHRRAPSSQMVYNLSGIDMETYLVSTSHNFIRNRYGGFEFGKPLPPDLQMDLRAVPKNRTLSKVWFNPDGHHTMPAYLNSLNNFILRSNVPADKDPSQYAISVSSHPYFGRVDNEDAVVQGMLQILVAMCVLTGYSITTAGFAIYEVKEHHTGSKRLQHIAGISEPFYWTVNFLYDMAVYMVPVTLTIIVVAAFQIPAFTDRQNLAAVTLLLVLFGFATFPWMYLLAGVFRNAEMAFIIYVCINLFISVNTIMSSSILYFLGQISERKREGIQEIFGQLCKAFHIFPQFNFGNGMMQLARKNIEVQLLSGYGIDAYQDPFSMDALGSMFLASFIQGLVFFTLRLLLNRFLLRKIRHLVLGRKTVSRLPGENENEDEDVAAEHQRVSSGAASSDVLQVNQLSKVFQSLSRKVQAVKHLSLGVPAGECFGLLGVNGAGKTTTFKMLTGDVSPTDGTAQIRDRDGRLVDIMECRNEGINIGYCPQVDALDELLTGEEHLYFYARIRGTPKSEIDQVVNYLLRRLELTSHRSIVTDGYSCGTRRKLSTALALIGHPQILLLDEPSSGMDPRTKRHLWKIISEEVKGKCAVVLTSHSMEECEALCSRLAIMVKGQFRCLGSLQHIKNRFGSGFTVKMYLAEAGADVEAISGFMQGRFPSTYLKDQHSSMLEYHIPVAPGGVAHIFDQLESNKGALRIKHFSVSQTTLDEVFINFAMGKVGAGSQRHHHHHHHDNDNDDMKEVQT